MLSFSFASLNWLLDDEGAPVAGGIFNAWNSQSKEPKIPRNGTLEKTENWVLDGWRTRHTHTRKIRCLF